MASFASRSRIGKLTKPLGSTTLLRGARRSWWLPISVALLLAVAGVWTRVSMERAQRAEMRKTLEGFAKLCAERVERWLDKQVRNAETMASRADIADIAAKLAKLDNDELADSPLQAAFTERVRDIVEANEYIGHGLIGPGGRLLASRRSEFLGRPLPPLQPYLATERSAVVTRPLLVDGQLAMIVLARIGDSESWIGFKIDPRKFTERLDAGSLAESIETYAFDADTRLISYSRFEDDLREIGLLGEHDRSILNIQIRNPGGNMVEGFKPTGPLRALPPTRMVASALALAETPGRKSVIESDIDGYNDYRGVPVVGAWTWLKTYDFGVTTEQDVAEAYATLNILRRNQWVLFAMLALAAVGAALYNLKVQRMRARVSAAQQLGQYTLGAKIGSGGMGEVYKATHAMLKRPTAIKLLPPQLADNERRVRFEREVQHTAQLAHHNTVAIYDYGTSPDGAFYYAMEFVDGITLFEMVERTGPVPAARVVHLLKQACGSLAEAHGMGIIHRDIKPANLMITHKTGMWDHLKVLDFGLVKVLGGGETIDVTVPGNVLGTPRYISPEGIRDTESVDARSDLYALGAVGYFLMAGAHLFEGETVIEIINQHLNTEPTRPSERANRELHKGLEDVILWCLKKDPDERPISAEALFDRLDALQDLGIWGRDESNVWWREYRVQIQGRAGESYDGDERPTMTL